jgi:hypothetical protein
MVLPSCAAPVLDSSSTPLITKPRVVDFGMCIRHLAAEDVPERARWSDPRLWDWRYNVPIWGLASMCPRAATLGYHRACDSGDT